MMSFHAGDGISVGDFASCPLRSTIRPTTSVHRRLFRDGLHRSPNGPSCQALKTGGRWRFPEGRRSASLRATRAPATARRESRMAGQPSKGTRVIALVGPAGAGKTGLAEAMLFAAGATDRLGSTANGSSIGDSSPESRQRGGSTELNLYNFEYLGDQFAILDIPGSVGFAADGARALAIADVAIVVVDPDPARAPLAAPALRALDELGIPHVIFRQPHRPGAWARARPALGAPADERVTVDRPADSDLGRRKG